VSKPKLRTEPLDQIIKAAKAAADLSFEEKAALYAAGQDVIGQVEEFIEDHYGDSLAYERKKLRSLRGSLAGILGFSVYDAPDTARFDISLDQDWYSVASAVRSFAEN
jgi:hypothetical protein